MTDSLSSPGPDAAEADKRFAHYISVMKGLKERSALRDVIEREILLALIQANQERINEFPLLPTHQRSIINMLFSDVADHPGVSLVNQLTAQVPVLVNQYEKALLTKDKELKGNIRTDLVNTEILVLKCVQGIVYTTAYFIDNFEEAIIKNYGPEAIKHIDSIREKSEINESFWQHHIDYFINSKVDAAYDGIIENEQYTLQSEKQAIVLGFDFDQVLAQLNPTERKIEKTRFQELAENSFEDEEAQVIHGFLREFIRRLERPAYLRKMTREDMDFLCWIAVMDPIGKQFTAAFTERRQQMEKGVTPEKDDELNLLFIQKQLLILFTGAAIASTILKRGFLQAVASLGPKKVQAIDLLINHFNCQATQRTLFYLLESRFLYLLHSKVEDEGTKVLLRSTRKRLVKEEDIDALFDHGLTRIRKNKLWGSAEKEGYLAFLPNTAMELKQVASVLALEPELLAQVATLWENAYESVRFLALLNLAQISRTTTNLKAKIQEILQEFGVSKT